jgi:hypothetical protein
MWWCVSVERQYDVLEPYRCNLQWAAKHRRLDIQTGKLLRYEKVAMDRLCHLPSILCEITPFMVVVSPCELHESVSSVLLWHCEYKIALSSC